jgi:hypothetical protein
MVLAVASERVLRPGAQPRAALVQELARERALREEADRLADLYA